MATVRTGLQMYDRMTGVLDGIMRSLNLTVSAMSDMQDSVERGFSSAAVDAARESIQQTEAALRQAFDEQERLNEAIQRQPEPPEPPKWLTEPTVEVFHSTGLERLAQEVADVTRLFDQLQVAQEAALTADTSFLPPEAPAQIDALNQRVAQLSHRFQEAVTERDRLARTMPPGALAPLNNDLERMRQQLADAVDQQMTLNDAMQAGDISGVNDAYRRLVRQVDAVEVGIRDNVAQQDRFNKSVQKGVTGADNLLSRVTKLVGAYLGFQATRRFLTGAFGAVNDQIRAEQRLAAVMSNINGMTQDGIELVKEQAKELENTTAIASNVGVFGQSQLAQYVYDPNNIAALTESMYNLATETYGVRVTQDQIKQTADLMGKAMMGQIDALSRNGFKLSAILSEEEIRLFEMGTEAERAALLVEVLSENQEQLAAMMAQTPEGAVGRLANAWGDVQTIIGYGLVPLIGRFTDLILGNLPTIQAAFVNVFDVVFRLFDGLITYGGMVVGFFVDNWSWIEPVIWGIVAALGAYLLMTKGVTLATQAVAAATAIWNAIMNMNPIVRIVTLIVGLMVWLYRLWQTNDQFAGGVLRAWHGLLNFFDQVPIFFTRVGNQVVNAFQNMKVKALMISDMLVNGVIDAINWLIDKLNKIPGVNIQAVAHIDRVTAAALHAQALEQAGDAALTAMIDDAAQRAADRYQRETDFLDNRAARRAQEEAEKAERFGAPDLLKLGSGPWEEIDYVNEVGHIRDSVDISSEDLRIMRDLAEMRNIQNFVTLQPKVEVTHTGDIKNGQDVKTIVDRIEEMLENQIASSAKAVLS